MTVILRLESINKQCFVLIKMFSYSLLGIWYYHSNALPLNIKVMRYVNAFALTLF